MNNALLEFAESLEEVISLVRGHRERLEAAGYSPTAAESMSIDLHREILKKIFSQ